MPHPKDAPAAIVLAEATSQGDGTTNYDFNLEGWSGFSIQIEDTAGGAGNNTYTVSMSNTDAVIGSAVFVAATANAFGVASWTTSAFACPVAWPFIARYARVTVVRAADGGGTDGEWNLTVRPVG